MSLLTWSASHAVWLTEIDDEHKEIFEGVSHLQGVLSGPGSLPKIRKLAQRLTTCVGDHFAHEERLMRAARYGSLRWHKQQHDHARKRVRQFVLQIEKGDTKAGLALVEYLTAFLRNHTRLADRMMGAFLRNEQRFMCKLTFQASTKPVDACTWTDANGDKFDLAH